MAEKKDISYADVEKVCNQLEADGRKISTRTVHAEIGGSLSTVLKFIRRWQTEKEAGKEAESGGLSGNFKAAIQEEIKRHVHDVKTTLQARIEELDIFSQEAQQHLSETEEKLRTATEDIERAAEENVRIRQQFEKEKGLLIARVEKAENQASDMEEKILSLQEQASLAEKRAAVAEAHAEDAVKMKEDRERLIIEMEKRLRDAEELYRSFERKITEMQLTTAESDKKAAVAEARLKEKETQLSSLMEELHEHKSKIDRITTDYQSSLKSITDSEKRAVQAETKLEVMSETREKEK